MNETYKILLYGDIVSYNTQEDSITTKKVFNELLKANGADLEVTINTLGGDVNEAFAIVQLFDDYKAKYNASIKSIALGECASSGVLLLLAGDIREVKENCRPFIHNVWTSATGDANTLINVGFALEDANHKVAKFYNERTGIDYDLARELMGLDTSLTAEECITLGFATPQQSQQSQQVDNKQLVLLNKLQKINNQSNTMKKDERSLFETLRNFFLGETPQQNLKEVHTATGETLEFAELEAEDTVEVGDEATIDGKAVEGEVITADGDKLDFEKGVVTEIEEADAEELEEVIEEVQEDEEKAQLRAEIETLRAELMNVKTQNTELINFKNKVTSTTSKEVIDQPKEINKADKKIDWSAEFLASKKARLQ